MENQEWRWDGTDTEFVELVKWAIVFRKLAKEQQMGWLKSAFDKAKMMNLCIEYGITEAAVGREIKKMLLFIDKRESDRRLAETFECALEEEVNGLISRGECFQG